MIVVTGAAGFVASCLVTRLNEAGYNDLVLVDDFSHPDRERNYINKKYSLLIDRNNFPVWLEANQNQVQFVFHLGARTDTAEFNMEVLNRLNLDYSKEIWKICTRHGIPLVYASSAATYGMGELGYSDDHSFSSKLHPLNPYGISKNEFDKWVLEQTGVRIFWAGLKFFNVYGPNEYHKGRMASVISHAFKQINQTGKMKLFRSHRPDYKDGEQLRDFVYVKDVIEVCLFLMENRKQSGIYNLGSGKARTFKDLVLATFKAMDKPSEIEFIDTPVDIRDKYQYFTEADMSKLISSGYTKPFTTLEEGVNDYVKNYLMNNAIY